jgi:hypothetical protein
MIKTGVIKIKRSIGAVNVRHNGKAVVAKKKETILDFAGAWNELPLEKFKALDKLLPSRRKTTRL